MSGYSRYLVPIFVLLMFFGCATVDSGLSKNIKIGKKAFEEEDFLILKALDYESNKEFTKSAKIYEELFSKSKKKHYIINALKLYLSGGNYDKLQEIIKSLPKDMQNKEDILRMKISIALHKLDFKKAKKIAEKLLKLNKDERNLQIAANIYLITKEFKEAYKYLQSAYKISNSENILLKIVALDYNYLERKKEALALLETHSRLYGCSINICSRLLEIYGANKDIDGLLHTYLELYKLHKNSDVGKKIVDLYVYRKDYKSAEKFLKESGFDDDILLDIYASQRKFKEAEDLSLKLFEKTSDDSYILKSAIYRYEGSVKKDKNVLKEVIKRFKKAIDKTDNPLFLNYYGYLLIDHDIDIEEGLKYVKKALKKDPNSPYYLDSLAWGYYKQKICKEAYEIMKKVEKKLSDDEVKKHIKIIKKCIEETK